MIKVILFREKWPGVEEEFPLCLSSTEKVKHSMETKSVVCQGEGGVGGGGGGWMDGLMLCVPHRQQTVHVNCLCRGVTTIEQHPQIDRKIFGDH